MYEEYFLKKQNAFIILEGILTKEQRAENMPWQPTISFYFSLIEIIQIPKFE